MCTTLSHAVEAVVDRISLKNHELAKRAKDIGSAAVVLSLTCMTIVWHGQYEQAGRRADCCALPFAWPEMGPGRPSGPVLDCGMPNQPSQVVRLPVVAQVRIFLRSMS